MTNYDCNAVAFRAIGVAGVNTVSDTCIGEYIILIYHGNALDKEGGSQFASF